MSAPAVKILTDSEKVSRTLMLIGVYLDVINEDQPDAMFSHLLKVEKRRLETLRDTLRGER